MWFKYIFIYYNAHFNIINLQGLREEEEEIKVAEEGKENQAEEVSSITSLA